MLSVSIFIRSTYSHNSTNRTTPRERRPYILSVTFTPGENKGLDDGNIESGTVSVNVSTRWTKPYLSTKDARSSSLQTLQKPSILKVMNDIASSFWEFRSSCLLWDWVVFIMSISWFSFPSRRSAWLSTLLSRHLTVFNPRRTRVGFNVAAQQKQKSEVGWGVRDKRTSLQQSLLRKPKHHCPVKRSVCMAPHSRFAFGMRRKLSYIQWFAV